MRKYIFGLHLLFKITLIVSPRVGENQKLQNKVEMCCYFLLVLWIFLNVYHSKGHTRKFHHSNTLVEKKSNAMASSLPHKSFEPLDVHILTTRIWKYFTLATSERSSTISYLTFSSLVDQQCELCRRINWIHSITLSLYTTCFALATIPIYSMWIR